MMRDARGKGEERGFGKPPSGLVDVPFGSFERFVCSV